MEKIDSDLLDELDEKVDHSFDSLLGEQEPASFSWIKSLGVVALLLLVVVSGFWMYQSYANRVRVDMSVSSLALEETKDTLPALEKQVEETSLNQSDIALGSLENTALAVEPAEKSAKEEDLENAFYRLVLGPFEDYNAAKQELDRLTNKGVSAYVWVQKEEDAPVYRVQVGAFKEKSRALLLKDQVSKKGFNSYVLRK